MRTVLRASGALGALALLLVGDLLAQGVPVPPPPGRREITSIDISPNGAWRARARNVRTARRAALARGDLRLLNGPDATMSVDGTYNLPIIFIAYSDTTVAPGVLGDPGVTPVIGDTGLYRSLFFSSNPTAEATPRPYSVKTFYEQLSNNHIVIQGNLYGWITTGFTYDFIGNNCAAVFCAGFTTRLGAMLRASLDSLNVPAHQVNWGQFDNDGPDGNPNSGDDDGFVDFVTFVHPSLGAECGGPGGGDTGDRIWAHRWTLAAVSGTSYTTQTARTGGGFIRINDYTIQSSRGGTGGCTAGSLMPIGTVAHETGHAFGLPDLYDTRQVGADEGIGEWGLMGSGNYARPYSPAAFEGWSLMEMGWVSVGAPTVGSMTIGPVQTADSVLRVPFSGTDEFLLLENRQFLQSDTAHMNPGLSSPPGKSPGLLIWHVDQSIVDGGRVNNTVNASATKGLRLVQADGLGQLQIVDGGSNRGDRGDVFPGASNVTSANATTNPALLSSNGRVARSISAIAQDSPNGPMSFTLSPSQFRLQATVVGTGTVSSNGGGALSAGVFTDSATATTLTAHPTGGATFTGWSGDTTGTDTVMVLPLRRPYTVVATFTGAVAVSYDQATDAILGITPLTGPQATYLDAVGNSNAVYDLGDYLAYLKANAIVPAPGVLRRISGARPLAPTKEQ
jgi:M6 family metalloprotease-like protein